MVVLSIQGKVHKRKEIDDDITSYEEIYIRLNEEYTDPIEFNKDLRSSAHSMADRLLPEGYSPLQREKYRMTINFNSVEAIKWAEEAAEYRDEDTKIDILTYWLQLFNTKRLRRAVHSVLKEEYGIETSVNL